MQHEQALRNYLSDQKELKHSAQLLPGELTSDISTM